MKFHLPLDTRSTWIKLGIIAILIRIFFGFCPQCCETLYSRGLYVGIRFFFDHTVGYLPFAGIYIFGIILVGWLGPRIYRFLRVLIKKEGIRGKGYGWSFLSVLSGTIFWFLLLWGYNYARVPVEVQLKLHCVDSMEYKAIWAEAQYIKNTCIEARNQIPNLDTHAITANYFSENIEDEMRQCLENALKEHGYDCSGHVRGRFLKPDGILLRFNSSGVYFPFTGEGNMDNGLPPICKPFTLAHELAHGYGFGSEDACNFWGYLACLKSSNPAIRYAGYLAYWRYVYGALMEMMTEEDYMQERATISRGMYNDLENIYALQDLYPPFIPFLQPAIYDVFLKMQGEEDGIRSYDRMVILVSHWRKVYG